MLDFSLWRHIGQVTSVTDLNYESMRHRGDTYDAIHRTGKICIKTEWLVKPPEKKPVVKHRPKNRTKGPVVRTGQRGRPRRLRDENGNKVERKRRKEGE